MDERLRVSLVPLSTSHSGGAVTGLADRLDIATEALYRVACRYEQRRGNKDCHSKLAHEHSPKKQMKLSAPAKVNGRLQSETEARRHLNVASCQGDELFRKRCGAPRFDIEYVIRCKDQADIAVLAKRSPGSGSVDHLKTLSGRFKASDAVLAVGPLDFAAKIEISALQLEPA